MQPDGTLWIGAEKGLFRAAKGQLQSFTKRDGLPGETVTAIAANPAANGDVWGGIAGGGLALVHHDRISLPDGER